MNLEYEITESKRITSRLRNRLAGLHLRDSGVWKGAIAALWLLTCAAVAAAAMGMPTGLGKPFDVTAGIALNTMGMAVASWLIAALLAICGCRVPRLTVGSLLYTGVLLYVVLFFSELGWKASLLYSAACALAAAGAGLLAGAMARLDRRGLRRALGLAAVLAFVAALLWSGLPQRFMPGGAGVDDAAQRTAEGDQREEPPLFSDPSEPGSFAYREFTYASGKDKHREEFGRQADLVSASVDASAYINNWAWLRKQFWGFDEAGLPLNGRVWMPEGEGPFPIVLMVHGNHLMENFSDDGYGYLGRLLASKGIAAVSIDENFLNYSVWSGIPDEDMKPRAWLMMKHIEQLQAYALQETSPFYGRIDFRRIALLGHSRGGQAAAMAADASRWFTGDAGLPPSDSYAIQAVIALAPTDTEVDGKRPELRDISYLTLQGAKDADLVNFYGDRQYGRVSFPSHDSAFKASLYIEDANHSQFNTSWGRSDNALPAGLFIRPQALLPAEDQRMIAEVYVAAFAETVLLDEAAYEPLFRDYRTAGGYLPDTRYYNQYENGDFRLLADFSGADREVPSPGATAQATDLSDWRHVNALNRQGEAKSDRGVLLEWQDEGSYTIKLDDASVRLADADEESILMFSLANMSRDLEEQIENEEEPEEIEALESAMETPLAIEIELRDDSGNFARLPLDEFMEAEPQVETRFTWLPGIEEIVAKGKFKDAEEPVYQTYELPLEEFRAANPGFDPSRWASLTFYFREGPGKVMLDSLGWIAGG